ncbi:MAG: recombinase family protein [Arenicella sp.]
MKIGYAKVSTNDQSLDLQIDALKSDGISETKIYHDYMSGSGRECPDSESFLKSLCEGDTLVIYSLDRMGRSTKDLISILTELKGRNVHERILDGIAAGIDTSTPMGEVFYTIAVALAQYERATLIQRTKAGLESARARGRVGGANQNYHGHRFYVHKLL